MLTQSRVKEVLEYSPSTGDLVWCGKRRGRPKNGTTAGSINSCGYITLSVDGKVYQAHRVVWLHVYGEFPKGGIDHINRVKTDNRIENLRCATTSENMRNRSIGKNNTSGHMGVSWNEGMERWVAFISDGRRITLGIFVDKEDAIAARKIAEKKYGYKEKKK